MREEWPEQLKRVQAEAGEPIALERLQNDVMGMNLRQLISAVSGIGAQVSRTHALVERRTAQLSPAKGGYGFDTSTYLARSESGLGHRQHTSLAPLIIPQRLFEESSSTATTPPSTPSAGPAPQDSSFEKSVNLILPPNEAFQAPDGASLWVQYQRVKEAYRKHRLTICLSFGIRSKVPTVARGFLAHQAARIFVGCV